MASATFTQEEQLSALQQALLTGAITQAIYNQQYQVLMNPPETFSWEKFFDGLLGTLSPVNWAKSFVAFFNIRNLIILGLIFGAFWFGLRDRIPVFNFGPNSLQGKSFTMILPGTPDKLVLDKSGNVTVVNTKTNKKVGTVRIKDIKGLDEAIHPIGFQFRLIGVLGMGAGVSGVGPEVGAGVSFFKFYNFETDAFATQRAIYLGESYRLTKFGSGNSNIGLALGEGYKGDTRVLIYYRWAF